MSFPMHPLRLSAKSMAFYFVCAMLLVLALFALVLALSWENAAPVTWLGKRPAQYHQVETVFWYALAGAALAIMELGVLGCKLIRQILLNEISRINQTANAIVGGDLSQRLAGATHDTEMGMLSTTVNRLLDKIEQLVHAHRQVSDSIAHDLRTPLTELRFRLESLALSKQPREVVYNEIDAAIADVDRVILIFNALLRLAEIDHRARHAGFALVDLPRMLDDVTDFYRPLAELKQIQLTVNCATPISTSADPLLLTQAVGNLVDNALKYTCSKVEVALATGPAAGQISISVTDDGAGISDEDKPRVMERFFRGNTSRDTDGVGLGLSMVVAVARLHGGNLVLEDAHPGLRALLLIQHRPPRGQPVV